MKIEIPKEKIADFCRKWKIVELSLFGSVLRDDFRPNSDVDLLVTFSPDAEWSLLDHMAMEEELSAIFRRKVDLVSRRAIERSQNYIRRKVILETAQPALLEGQVLQSNIPAYRAKISVSTCDSCVLKIDLFNGIKQ